MRTSLPPLGALRTFVAVAKHLSFTKAAKELHVTPAAVTHQINALEQDLGTQLFCRNRQYVALTRAAEVCLPELAQAFEMIRSAVVSARAATDRAVLNVSVSPAFASKVLLPRLTEFSELHPDIDLRLSATAQLAELDDGETDLAIRFGAGHYKGTYAERMLPEYSVPLCAPALLQKGAGLKEPDDLRHHRLVHDLSIVTPDIQPDWRAWLLKAGVKGIEPSRGLRFSLADLALQAAINGFGVVLGRKTLAMDDLAHRRLVLPFDLELPVTYSYFIVIPKKHFKSRTVGDFRDWLMSIAFTMQSSNAGAPVNHV